LVLGNIPRNLKVFIVFSFSTLVRLDKVVLNIVAQNISRKYMTQSASATSGPLSDYLQEALRVVEYARQKGVTLRVIGAAALRIHCPNHVELHKALGRELTDLDFVGYEKQSEGIDKVFADLGYDTKQYLSAMMDRGLKYRKFFYDKNNKRVSDVFLDILEMCHIIDFKGRLEIDYPTVSLTDYLLAKMQIVKLNEKDVKDTIVLFIEHDVGNNDKEMVDSDYISRLLSEDWGFYYTFTTNLNKIKQRVDGFEVIPPEEKQKLKWNLDSLLKVIEERPKSFKWRMRARIGTKQKWYNEVEEVVR